MLELTRQNGQFVNFNLRPEKHGDSPYQRAPEEGRMQDAA